MNQKLPRRLLKRLAPLVAFLVILSVSLTAAPDFIGNVIGNSTPANFTTYWNQVTSENASKWGSVESSRDSMNWGSVDSHYNYANSRGFPYKFHTLVWGSQEPGWIGGLSQSEQLAEVVEWIQAVGQRYSPDMIDVVNEPLHAPASYRNALGGSGSTGWDWVIESFRLARQYCSGQLLINDYGIISDGNAVSQYLTIINLLKDRGLVDGIGIQCHHFNVDTAAASTLQSNLDRLAATGLPIYVSELDIQGDDSTQNQRYRDKFPVFYNSSSVRGITVWGYIQGQTWRDNTHLVSSGSVGASERPAMQWLKQFLGGNPVTPPPATPTPVPATPPPGSNITVRARGTMGGENLELHVNGNTVASWTMSTSYQNFYATGSGSVELHFTNDDQAANGMDIQVDYIIYNNTTFQAEDQAVNTGVYENSACGGSYSEMLQCNGYIQFTTGPVNTPTPTPIQTTDRKSVV